MPKNYYIVLGIPADSTQEEIKDAYRRLAKEFHPDRYGGGHSPFQIIQEAYSVLGDPVRRRAYDHRRQQQRSLGGFGIKAEAMRAPMRASVEPEPLNPGHGPHGLGEVWPTRSFESFRSSFDALFDHLFSNFSEGERGRADRSEPLAVLVTLTPDQALRGGHVRLSVPADIVCPSCRGAGSVGFYECRHCSGAGSMSGEFPLMVSYPPGVSDSHVVRLSLERFGMGRRFLDVRFRISDLI